MSVGPPFAQSLMWWTWLQAAGTVQPGRVHPRSVAVSTRRWAAVASRVVRPL
ncbi:MAG: hypothetical protein QOH60_3566 [Mycobacterium sp.]|jgi:hypothetical protein|nr:hypothetical protein [Mycobacterium sp.]